MAQGKNITDLMELLLKRVAQPELNQELPHPTVSREIRNFRTPGNESGYIFAALFTFSLIF